MEIILIMFSWRNLITGAYLRGTVSVTDWSTVKNKQNSAFAVFALDGGQCYQTCPPPWYCL
jgi:hypothetical protein